jgi:hypothetical protein
MMTEQEAIDKIEEDCRSGDYEGNGCLMDEIVGQFLRDNGFIELADQMDSVKCWRA